MAPLTPTEGQSASAAPAGSGSPDSQSAHNTYIESNRALWDAWTRLHVPSKSYDVAGFKAGRSKLTPLEIEELGDVSGKTLLHLQCHFGMDTLSWARRGAIVTGADFSPQAIAAASALAAEMGIPARFVCASVYDLPTAPELRGERFDVVFTSYGVLTWLPDLRGWARTTAHFLAPGGVFYIADTHPMTRVFDRRTSDDKGNPLPRGYFHDPQPARSEEHGSYAVPEEPVWTTAYYWRHTLGDVVTAVAEAGLRVEFLHEHPNPPDATYMAEYPKDLPCLFSLKATQPVHGAVR